METLIAYAISLVITSGGAYAVGRQKGRQGAEQLTRARVEQIQGYDRDRLTRLGDISESLVAGFREMNQEMSKLGPRLEDLEARVQSLQIAQQEAATQAATSMASLLEERTRSFVTREEVQQAFEQVARDTAARELARQQEIQRQMARREEVFGPARNPAPTAEVGSTEELEALRRQIESLRPRAKRG